MWQMGLGPGAEKVGGDKWGSGHGGGLHVLRKGRLLLLLQLRLSMLLEQLEVVLHGQRGLLLLPLEQLLQLLLVLMICEGRGGMQGVQGELQLLHLGWGQRLLHTWQGRRVPST